MTPVYHSWFTIATFKDIPTHGNCGQKEARESLAFH
jgi:hypothetical protein